MLDLCDAAGVSATELATRVGTSRASVYAWSARRKRPLAATIAGIAEALGLPRAAVDAVLAPYRRPGAPRKH